MSNREYLQGLLLLVERNAPGRKWKAYVSDESRTFFRIIISVPRRTPGATLQVEYRISVERVQELRSKRTAAVDMFVASLLATVREFAATSDVVGRLLKMRQVRVAEEFFSLPGTTSTDSVAIDNGAAAPRSVTGEDSGA